VPVEQLQARGHFHSSLTMVDVVLTGVEGRVKMAEALHRFAGLTQKAGEGTSPSRNVLPQEATAAAE
jgi:hypothetical protein